MVMFWKMQNTIDVLLMVNGADVLGKYLNKGKRIYIEGRLRTRKWQDSEGVERFSTEDYC
jgi:single-strand DNA-binding protein